MPMQYDMVNIMAMNCAKSVINVDKNLGVVMDTSS